MKPVATKMTYDQYCLLPEDGNHYELFDGELVRTPSPAAQHQRIVLRLASELDRYVKTNGLGEVFVAPLDTIFDQYTMLQPDILYVSRERVPLAARGGNGVFQAARRVWCGRGRSRNLPAEGAC